MTAEVINGWTILVHPQMIAQYKALIDATKAEKKKNPKTYQDSKPAKLLAAVIKLMDEDVPADPTDPKYRLGNSLGKGGVNWFRAKFYQQFRLFFRYSTKEKIIIFAWVNDEDTKRAYESADDAYKIFEKMLTDGSPPNNWTELKAEAEAAIKDFAAIKPSKPAKAG